MTDLQYGTGACLVRMPNHGRRIASLCAHLTLLLGCITACHSDVVANKRPRDEAPTASIAVGPGLAMEPVAPFDETPITPRESVGAWEVR